jgi:hypothetical protein
MSSITANQLASPALTIVLAYAELKMAVFQRHFGWGEGSKERAGLDYLKQFLLNRHASDYFGQISLFSLKRWDYDNDENIEVWVGDGQHRTVTVVLVALALVQHLRQIEANTNIAPFRREEVQDLLGSEVLSVLAASKLEVLTESFGHATRVVPFIQAQLALRSGHVAAIAEVTNRYLEKRGELRRNKTAPGRSEARKAATQEKNREVARLEQAMDNIDKIGVFRTYQLIDAYFADLKDDVVVAARSFVERIREMRTSLVCLEPKPGYPVNLATLETESFSNFSNINVQTYPLSAGELLGSHIRSRPESHAALGVYFREKTAPEHEAARFFGMVNSEKLCEYLTRMSTGDDSTKSFTWVKEKLYSGTSPSAILADVETWMTTLQGLYAKIQAMSEPWKALYSLFFRDFNRTAFAVVSTRFVLKQGLDKCDESFLKSLLRALVLFEIAAVYRPPSNTKFNIGRDTPTYRMTAWGDGVALVQNHFGAASLEELHRSMCAFVATAPLGLSVHRKLAKFLLVLADVNNGGREVQLPAWASYEYEHIFPQKHTLLLDEADLSEAAFTGIKDVLDLPDLERGTLVHQLGNGALLAKAENVSNSNHSPYRKYQMQAKHAKYSNAWWPSHLKALQDVQGEVTPEFIQRRSDRLARQALDFLLGEAWATTVTVKTTVGSKSQEPPFDLTILDGPVLHYAQNHDSFARRA